MEADILSPEEAPHRLLIVCVSETLGGGTDVYRAARQAWKAKVDKARRCDYVLAVHRNEVVGAFAATDWLPATRANFPERRRDQEDEPHLIGFHGTPAPDDVRRLYLGRRLPPEMRLYGQIRYWRLGDAPSDRGGDVTRPRSSARAVSPPPSLPSGRREG